VLIISTLHQILLIISRERHIERMGDMKNACRILSENLEGKNYSEDVG
jgi:hypothetical protein